MTNEQLYILLSTMHDQFSNALEAASEAISGTRTSIPYSEWQHIPTAGCERFMCNRKTNPEHWQEVTTENPDPVYELAPVRALLEEWYTRLQVLRG